MRVLSGRIAWIGVASLLLIGSAAITASRSPVLSAESTVPIPAAVVDANEPGERAQAIFAGGCFWGVQGVFQHVRGVRSAVSGYAGGNRANARYDRVSGGNTGHAEAVRIDYDPRVVSYGTLLRIFFSVVHDPTQRDRQGNDVGPQYRSAIFPTTAEQRRVAAAYVAQLAAARAWKQPIATRIERAPAFFPAEAYHQDYLTRNPDQPYIRNHDLPKIAALKRSFPALYRERPLLVSVRG